MAYDNADEIELDLSHSASDSDDEIFINGRLALGAVYSGTTAVSADEACLADVDMDEPLQHDAQPSVLPDTAYLQPATLPDFADEQLWRLPDLPDNVYPRKLREVVENGAAAVYYKSCGLIRRNWECEPQQGLPDALHNSTPYSLILLLQLRALSSHSKRCRLRVHVILNEFWRQRIANLGVNVDTRDRSYERTDVAQLSQTFGFNLGRCESEIQENIYGLRLVDVVKTHATFAYEKKMMKMAKKEVKLSNCQAKNLDERMRRAGITLQIAASVSRVVGQMAGRERPLLTLPGHTTKSIMERNAADEARKKAVRQAKLVRKKARKQARNQAAAATQEGSPHDGLRVHGNVDQTIVTDLEDLQKEAMAFGMNGARAAMIAHTPYGIRRDKAMSGMQGRKHIPQGSLYNNGQWQEQASAMGSALGQREGSDRRSYAPLSQPPASAFGAGSWQGLRSNPLSDPIHVNKLFGASPVPSTADSSGATTATGAPQLTWLGQKPLPSTPAAWPRKYPLPSARLSGGENSEKRAPTPGTVKPEAKDSVLQFEVKEELT